MANKIWIDPQGREIPSNRVLPEEKSFEKICNRIQREAKKVNSAMENLKNMFVQEYGSWLNDQSQYGMKEDWRGNATVANFSGTVRLVREEKERIEFDHNIQIFQRKIYEWLKNEGKRASIDFKKVVDNAFKVNSKGNLSRQRMADLRHTPIKDNPEWEDACSYYDKAITVVNSKAFWAIEFKNSNGDWDRLPLNFYDIVPQIDEESESKAA
ncbi:MAG: DUF3164 family protein [Balneola sp.]